MRDVSGLGPLEPLMADRTVEEVMVNGPDLVYVERAGSIEQTDARFEDEEHLSNTIERILAPLGRRVDESSPMADARLDDGSRVNVVIPPLAIDGAALSIRRFPRDRPGPDWLVGNGTLGRDQADELNEAVGSRKSIIVSGGTGSGKTTLLNALARFIPEGERIVTIEDAAELRMASPHVVRLETRAANVEGVGEVTSRDLVRNALRMRPDRIIVGECRGAEAMDMLQAMNSGHAGSMTTLHANSARDALHRLESMLAMGGLDVPIRVLRDYVASALDVIVQLARLPDGRRVVSEVVEVIASPDEGVRTETIHRFRLVGVRDGQVIGGFEATGVRPGFMARLDAQGIRLEGRTFDAGLIGKEVPG
jgi:pilus assembly protein CpaF